MHAAADTPVTTKLLKIAAREVADEDQSEQGGQNQRERGGGACESQRYTRGDQTIECCGQNHACVCPFPQGYDKQSRCHHGDMKKREGTNAEGALREQ